MVQMRKVVVTLAALATIAVFAAASTAGYAGKASKPNSGTSSIALASVMSGDGTTKLAAGVKPALGNRVTFATTVGSIAGWEYPMVDLECRQNGVIVFSQLDKPDATFLLGGGSSVWLTTGGAATCTADLDAYGTKGGTWSVRVLSETSFDAAG